MSEFFIKWLLTFIDALISYFFAWSSFLRYYKSVIEAASVRNTRGYLLPSINERQFMDGYC